MRLIDADKLIVELKNLAKGQISSCPNIAEFFVSIRVDRIIDILNSQPTAFDVEKVVEQLEETREKDIPRINNTTTKRDEKVYKLAMSYAIDIVKAGGIDE